MQPELEVDPLKACSRRFAHRDIDGIDTDNGRECPACREEAGVPLP